MSTDASSVRHEAITGKLEGERCSNYRCSTVDADGVVYCSLTSWANCVISTTPDGERLRTLPVESPKN